MAGEGGVWDSDVVDGVMNEVLMAEQEARAAVDQCRAQAARIVAEAEGRARRIGQRNERRIRLTHRIADRAVERALRELRGPQSGQAPEIPEGEAAELLYRAVDALVEEILR
jgi:vacuolar-type H+-ATPase subunit H